MRGYFLFVRVWVGERDLVTILVSIAIAISEYSYSEG